MQSEKRIAESRIVDVHRALQRQFRIAGRGSVSRVQEQLDLGAGYFKNQRRAGRRRVDLKVLLRALEVLEVDPAEFFAGVLGPADPVDVFKTEAAALRRQLRGVAVLKLVAKRDGDATQEVDLEALDGLREEDPRQVLRQARSLVARIVDRQLPRLLGIYASACRAAGKADEAQVVLARALDLAEDRDDPALVGDLLQRASHVLNARAETEQALAVSERATLCYTSIGDSIGIGKTLVDQGAWLGLLDRRQEELQAFHGALRYLAPAEKPSRGLRIYRFACLTNLGVAYRKCGDLEQARRYAAQAREISPRVGPRSIGKLIWLQASIARESGRYREAERFYQEALEMLRPIEPVDAAIATIDLVRTQLDSGRTVEAYATAKAMAMFLQPLERDRVASALITELIRCALNGRGLTLARLNKVARGLETERARQAAPVRRSRR